MEGCDLTSKSPLQICQLGPIRAESGFLHRWMCHWSKVRGLFCQKMLLTQRTMLWTLVTTWMSASMSWIPRTKPTHTVISPAAHTRSSCISKTYSVPLKTVIKVCYCLPVANRGVRRVKPGCRSKWSRGERGWQDVEEHHDWRAGASHWYEKHWAIQKSNFSWRYANTNEPTREEGCEPPPDWGC